MTHFSCLVQDDGAANARRSTLEERLAAHHAAHYPGEQPTFSWRAAGAGFMFTAGQPSTSSVISCQLGSVTTRVEREQYMRGVTDVWSEITGCTVHDVLVSISATDQA